MAKKQCYIGVDLGGTTIEIILRSKKEILRKITKKTNSHLSKEKIIQNITNTIKLAIKNQNSIQIKGIGMGVPGSVSKDGKIITLANIPTLNETDIKSILKKEFKTQIKIANDANLVYHAIKDEIKEKNTIVLTLGTGLGTALILNGKQYTGSMHGTEMAHAKINKTTTFEDNLSKRFLLKEAKKLKIKSVKEMAQKAKTNPKVKIPFQKFGQNLGFTMANIHSILGLEKIYLTGGMTKSSHLFLKEAKENFQKFCKYKPCEVEVIKKPYPIGAYGASKMFKE